jgi:Fe-S-cluster containining protein
MPGICEPKDIIKNFPAKTLKESILKALRTKNYSIDWFEGDKNLYYIRPSTLKGKGKIYDASWGGQCVFLTAAGCSLKGQRPLECRMLYPRKTVTGDCSYALKYKAKKVFGRLWRRYIDLGNFEYSS